MEAGAEPDSQFVAVWLFGVYSLIIGYYTGYTGFMGVGVFVFVVSTWRGWVKEAGAV